MADFGFQRTLPGSFFELRTDFSVSTATRIQEINEAKLFSIWFKDHLIATKDEWYHNGLP